MIHSFKFLLKKKKMNKLKKNLLLEQNFASLLDTAKKK
jgi:hypothetical protein